MHWRTFQTIVEFIGSLEILDNVTSSTELHK